MQNSFATRVFGAAAVFNVAVGTSAFLAPGPTLGLLGIELPPHPIFMHLAMWLVVALGIGYGLTALHPARNRDLMLVGGVGKILVLPLMLVAWGRGDVGLAGVAAGGGDFAFALAFFAAWRRLDGTM